MRAILSVFFLEQDKRDICEDFLVQGMGVVNTAARMVLIILVFQNG